MLLVGIVHMTMMMMITTHMPVGEVYDDYDDDAAADVPPPCWLEAANHDV